ncbi:MAG: response regulator [Fusobacteriota bacterium]
MNYPKRGSLKFKLTLLAVMLIIFPMGIATLYNIHNYSDKAKKELMNSLRSQNYSINQIINTRVDKINEIAESIAEEKGVSVTIQFDIESQLREYIKDLEYNNKLIDKLVIYNSNKDKFVEDPKDNSLKRAILNAKKENDFRDGILSDGKFNIVALAPIKNNYGKIIGIVGVKSSIVKHVDYIKNVLEKLEMNVVLMNKEEIFLVGKHDGKISLSTYKIDLDIPDEIQEEMFELEKSIKIKDESYHIFLRNMNNLFGERSGYIGTIKNIKYLENSIKEITRNMIYIALGGIIVAMVLSISILNFLLTPLKNLIKSLEKIRKGDLTERVEVKNNDEIGRVGKYLNSAVSRIEKIEKNLKESEARFKALHNASFGGIAIHDEGEILDCNKGLSELTGYTFRELIHMDILNLIAKESRDLVENKSISDYEKPYEAVGVRKNGEQYPLRLEARSIPYKGKQVKVLEFRDITDIIKTKTELIVAKEKAEKANQAKNDFLANMSHELRTPLNGILGFADMLKDMEEDEEKKDMAILIEESGVNLLRLINDILNLSKIESGKINLNLENFKLDNVIENLQKSIQSIIKNNNQNIDFSIIRENKIPEYVKTDKYKLKYILINLLSNAYKFTKKGKIELRIKYLKNEKLRFQVVDTGIGISEKNQKRIFEKFIQGEHYMTKQYEGTGLGLTINLELVNLLGGHIELDSEEGKGSAVTVIIPIETLSSENIKESDNKYEYKQIDKNKKIIIAEDDRINQKLVQRLCSSRGLKVDAAYNGVDLLDKITKKDYDLILMDIQMPGLDGVNATKEIRKRGLETPIVAVTAFSKKEDEEYFLKIGMDGYISKPIDKILFHKMLDKYLI